MKKLCNILFSSVPMILALGIQTVVLIFFYLSQSMDFIQVVYIVFCVCCIIVFGIWYVKRCNGNLRLDFKKDFHPLEILGIIFLVPGTQYMSSILTALLATIFPSWLGTYEELLENAGLNNDISLIMIIYAVFLAPISEELIFRGVTYQIARRVFPFWIANIIQAFFFGVFHQNMLQGCYTFVLALFLGYICEKGGSIYHVILLHFLFNLWGTVISPLLLVDNVMLQGLIIIGGTVIGLGLGLFFFQKGNKAKKQRAVAN